MQWILWIILLVFQNASFTLVSRARNSKSIFYHASAAVASNGIWFASQFFIVDVMLRAKHDLTLAVFAGLLYTSVTTLSSVAMHKLLLTKVEPRIKNAQ